jgi:hypothetical protein
MYLATVGCGVQGIGYDSAGNFRMGCNIGDDASDAEAPYVKRNGISPGPGFHHQAVRSDMESAKTKYFGT